MESRVALKAAQIQGNDRNVRVAGFFECPPDKANIIRSTTAATSLRYNHSELIGVIFSR